jgi:hypothetical protein
MVDQTIFATKKLLDGSHITPHSWLHSWQPITKEEMRTFVGLLAWIGLVQIMWARAQVAPNSTSRNRSEILLWMWHFSSNEEWLPNDRLHKIQPLTNMYYQNFKEWSAMGKLYWWNNCVILSVITDETVHSSKSA